jgi:hypothetical protein
MAQYEKAVAERDDIITKHDAELESVREAVMGEQVRERRAGGEGG